MSVATEQKPLSAAAERVLSELRHPQTEDGWQTWKMLGLVSRGTAARIKAELLAAGHVLEGRPHCGVRLIGAQRRHQCGERPMCGPVRVELKSSVLGPGGRPDAGKDSDGLTLPSEARGDGTAPASAHTPREHQEEPEPAAGTQGPPPFAGVVTVTLSLGDEFAAITRCIEVIEGVEPEARPRIAAYLAARYRL